MFSANPYEEVKKELSQGIIDQTLYLRSFAEGGGDEDRTMAIYIQHRAQMFAAFYQAEQLNLRRAERERAAVEARRSRENARWDAKLRREQYWNEHAGTLIAIGALVFIILLFWLGSSPK